MASVGCREEPDQADVLTSQFGQTAEFNRAKLGELEKVIDPLDGETIYGYDPAGNRTSQTDAEGRTMEMEYDDHGRLIKRILPLGQEETQSGSVTGQIRELRSSCRLPKSAEGGSR
jgi:YD repeat-containing protein